LQNGGMSKVLHGISSMATRQVLAELAAAWREQAPGVEVVIESVGGVDAAKRVMAGEDFDVVMLAGDAMARLLEAGRLEEGSLRIVVEAVTVAAVPERGPRPEISSVKTLQAALCQARRIGYSTGPSGNALLKLIEAWGLGEALAPKLVQTPPGVPVGQLLARGEVDLGFQQYSELFQVPGVAILGPLPPGAEVVTPFVAGIGAACTQREAALSWLDFITSIQTASLKQACGLQAPP
jgi:molybdate transport system substrate-binding protein